MIFLMEDRRLDKDGFECESFKAPAGKE